MSDLVGNQSCWFSHAAAHFIKAILFSLYIFVQSHSIKLAVNDLWRSRKQISALSYANFCSLFYQALVRGYVILTLICLIFHCDKLTL